MPPLATPSSASTKIRFFRGYDQFRELRPQWIEMMTRSNRPPTLMSSPGFFDCLLRSVTSSATNLAFAGVLELDQLQAVVPLSIHVESIKGLKLRSLVLADRTELFVGEAAMGDNPAVLETSVGSILETARLLPGFEYDYVAIKRLPVQSPLLRALTRSDPRAMLVQATTCCHVPMDGLANGTRGLTGNDSRENRRRERRLADLGDVRMLVAPDDLPMDEAFEDLLAVESSGWKGETGTSLSSSPQRRELYRLLAQNGGDLVVKIPLLRLDGKTIAAQYILQTGPTLVTLTVGFDQAYTRVSPGLLLDERVVQWCRGQPSIDTCNFWTSAHWVDRWRPVRVPLMNWYASRRTPRGLLAMAALRWKHRKNDLRSAAMPQPSSDPPDGTL